MDPHREDVYRRVLEILREPDFDALAREEALLLNETGIVYGNGLTEEIVAEQENTGLFNPLVIELQRALLKRRHESAN